MRKSLRVIAAAFAAAKALDVNAAAGLSLVCVGTDKALKFVADVSIAGDVSRVCDDKGKVKTFSTVDDFLKFAAKVAEKGNGVYVVTVDTGALLASSVPSNLKTFAAAKVVSLGKTKTAQLAVIGGIDDDLTLMVGWENGNAAQQARKTEVLAQRAVVVADVDAIDDDIDKFTAIANS